MIRTNIFKILVIAICLAACLCAIAAETEKDKADKAVEDVVALAQKALKSAQDSDKQAKSMLTRVNSYKKIAEDAVAEVKTSSKGNSKAEVIAVEVKQTSDEIIALFPKAKTAADAAVKSMADLLKNANELSNEANIEVVPDEDSSDAYTKILAKVTEVTGNVSTFQQTMQREQTTTLPPATTAELQMSRLVEKVKVGKYHISVILSVSKIESLLEKANADIRRTEQQRDEVNKTLKEMTEHSKNAPEKLTVYVSRVLQNAEGSLSTASKTVNDAKKVKEDMIKIKTTADAALAKFKGETNSEKVHDEVRNVRKYAEDVEKKMPEIAKALQSAEITAKNAKANKQSFFRTISSGNPQPSGEEDKIINKTGEPVKHGEKSPVNNEKAIPSGGNNDSAVTVSFSLLLAFITCAFLH